MRITQYIARSGYCSRRQADVLVKSGSVFVDGLEVKVPYFEIRNDNIVTIFGNIISLSDTRVFILNKPKGYLTSKFDVQGRKTIYELLPCNLKNYITIGRLDYNTEGLILITNDGMFSNYLTLPSNKIIRYYKVEVFGYGIEVKLKKLESCISVNGVRYRAMIIKSLHRFSERRAKVVLGLTEGKNREIRKALSYVGLTVDCLMRFKFGRFLLPNDLRKGEHIEASSKIVNYYKNLYRGNNL